jgi:hypothetical protein
LLKIIRTFVPSLKTTKIWKKIAYDLGYPFSKQDYNAKLIENIVKENFESFFKFYNSDLNLLIQYYLKIILIQY